VVDEDMRPASYELVGFITHLGPSVQVGHYIAHTKKDGKWVAFNDEKVFIDPDAPTHLAQAYVYVFQRK
jgi:ubiquitin carboxyl-terminal hydrolase 5/13